MRLYRPLGPTGLFYRNALFRIRSAEKTICLTFDDGPDPDSTVRILDILNNHGIRAMFFMTGYKAEKHPHLRNLIISQGHLPGNHGYLHLKGWRTPNREYHANALKAVEFTSGFYFRPPYGQIGFFQYRKLASIFRIVFWDVMPYDFDSRLNGKKCFEILKRKIRPGSIIVLHDSPDSTLFEFLDEFILFAAGRGYKFVVPV